MLKQQYRKIKSRPNDVGILAMEVYFPNLFVQQDELEKFDNCSQGKYTIGLGQQQMGFCDNNEDINSLCLTVVTRLMKNYSISYEDIGRLEVGTETIVDKSKSVKTYLMQLFESSGNFNVEGLDTTNACYGGTNALFNSVAWIESSSWDGRYALAVCGDIAVYASGNARCTGGAGAVAMLVGPNAPLVFEPGLRYSYIQHSYDFYKPDLASEYPVVDGKLTLSSYITALDKCYQGYCGKAEYYLGLEDLDNRHCAEKSFGIKNLDYILFHCPYCKLVQKSVARLLMNDIAREIPNVDGEHYQNVHEISTTSLNSTIGDRVIEKSHVADSREIFDSKTSPSLMLSRRVGNMYTPSLYSCLISLIYKTSEENLLNKRICMFSYGSGLAASMFSIVARQTSKSNIFSIAKIKLALGDLIARLEARKCVEPDEFTKVLENREKVYNKAGYKVSTLSLPVASGTYVLTEVDEMFRRKYKLEAEGQSTGGSL